ncbi:MAG TPA: DHH family phosphoesterase [Algoriphagus sp.]|jgi:phosphoesterase RecJ-like protein|uniref:DHH family phosphoesterase n=1 Tax=unclassified Algoriphagus TaxID=2641541 RepID=UPI000C4534C2|nr:MULTISPECIES: bifunctional oligoribonuclease/PAP phosphatase NrnA [unclassified Algoriphagus]MAL15286.1 DHH family phosphoesterase [Algoriphagus sp.]QYH40713.1 bifunctional oligoribonuclease/PAP phosphatase NrnA [Algoriphagus sp. NBT04N3]HAH37453.1 DHH family phosphoesterase [Algoriphagus sp.]HAS57515.1 DHH family phosphoesterase [Algoriphagus sp.]HAZ26518.1 DHH family phosphoesterase [Algoriphagus sp.]|tara:strand:+ start:5990 stop:7024 length:1035 start_codon:yes stop_codon:yes gene_type:complete
MEALASFKKEISSPKKIFITTHVKPDADALGSSLGLANYLLKKGHEVTVVTPTDYPSFLNWMEGNDLVLDFSREDHQKSATKALNEADVVFCLDFSVLNRVNELGEMIRQSDAFIVNIDHHQDPEDFADFKYWSTEAAATCELVYELIVELGDKELIDKDIAASLYAGIMTDTGGFRHPNTTKNVHLVVAELIDLGANPSQIANWIYDSNSVNRLKFIGFAISRRLVVREDIHTAYFAISKKDLKKYQSRTGDTEGLVNYALSLDGIKLAALFSERDDGIKISFRSSSEVAVNKFAASYFNGGGHKNAAGGKSERNLKETIEKFENLVEEHQDELFDQEPVSSN